MELRDLRKQGYISILAIHPLTRIVKHLGVVRKVLVTDSYLVDGILIIPRLCEVFTDL